MEYSHGTVNALGEALPPLIIFKGKHVSSEWIPEDTLDCFYSTSTSGWTSDSYGFEWLKHVFEPSTRPCRSEERRLLIMDGHSSHMTANVIAYAMDKAIDLLVLPVHTSHVLQPLDIIIFT